MNTKIRAVLDAVRNYFWFIPSVMTIAAILLSLVAIRLDAKYYQQLQQRFGWIFSGGPEGARAVMQAISGSMITVAGVVFSVTVVTLSLASQQFGPRILRTLIRDRANQFVLGTFLSTFVYCLLVLRIVRGEDGATFVPNIAITGGILLAIVSLGVLIFFVHHSARSIQAASVIGSVGSELDDLVRVMYPEQIGKSGEEDCDGSRRQDPCKRIPAKKTGYVQLVDGERLMKIARKFELLIRIEANPGSFVRSAQPLAAAWPDSKVSGEVEQKIRRAFTIGDRRTAVQDVDFLFRQLAEIAVRSLSAGINDPFTALNAIDRLGATLGLLAGRELPPRCRHDQDGVLRVLAEPPGLPGAVEFVFGQIRLYGKSNVAVMLRLMLVIRTIAPAVHREEDRTALLNEARLTAEVSREWSENMDRARIEQEYRKAAAALRETAA